MLVELCLRILEVPYEFVPVALESGEQFSAGFQKLNPRARVPVLELAGGRALVESTSICRYLCRLHQREDLFPTDPLAEYQLESWIDHIRLSLCSPLGVVQWHRIWLGRFGKKGADPDLQAIVKASKQVYRVLDDIELHLLGRNHLLSPYGEAPSFADWISLPWLGYYRPAGISLRNHPRVKAWLDTMQNSQHWLEMAKDRPLLQLKHDTKTN
jgi:GST-like protein